MFLQVNQESLLFLSLPLLLYLNIDNHVYHNMRGVYYVVHIVYALKAAVRRSSDTFCLNFFYLLTYFSGQNVLTEESILNIDTFDSMEDVLVFSNT